MKRIVKKYTLFCCILAMSIWLTGCMVNMDSNGAGRNHADLLENGKYDIGLAQVQQYNEKLILDKDGQVSLRAVVGTDAKIGEKDVSDIMVLAANEESILVKYQISMETQVEEADEYVEELYEYHIVCFDRMNDEIKKELTFIDYYVYIDVMNQTIVVEKYADDNIIMECYDFNLESIGIMTIPTENSGSFSSDGERYYLLNENTLCCYEVETGISNVIEMGETFLPEYVVGVVTVDGADYVIMNGMAKDYKRYQIIYDINRNDVFRVNDTSQMYVEVNNDVYVEAYYLESGEEYWLVGTSKDKAYEYSFRERMLGGSIYVVDNEWLMCAYGDGKKLNIAMCNQERGACIGSAEVDFTEFLPVLSEDYYSEEMYGTSEIYISGNIVYLYENTWLLQFVDRVGNRYYCTCRMDENAENKDDGFVNVKKHTLGDAPGIAIADFEGLTLHPGEVSEELMPLKQMADKLEQKYDVEIYIGEECANVLGGYAVHALNDYAMVEEALETLDQEMARYPDNFFEQFDYLWLDGISIHIASEIIGIEEGMLSSAGGFHFETGGRSLLVLDCNNTYALATTFHHELSHAIENKIIYSETEEDVTLDVGKWESFNTYENLYTYSYENWYDEAYVDLIYDNALSNEGDLSNVCFVDTYSMSYPREDRARLFESAMCDYYEVDFDSAPRLKAKLNYYAECIRKVFDTTGWEDVPWEK